MIPIRAYFRLFTGYLRPHRRRSVLLALVLVSTIALQLLNPQLIRLFIDGAITGDDVSALVPLALAFMGVAVVHQLLSVCPAVFRPQYFSSRGLNHGTGPGCGARPGKGGLALV